MSKSAEFYREKAEEMRDLARRAADPKLRASLTAVAAQYDRLAQAAGR